MKVCFMYIPPKLSNFRYKGRIISRAILKLDGQYMFYHHLNALMPVIPAVIDSLKNVIKK